MPAAHRNAAPSPTESGVYVMYGLSCSYFTGKLQAYFQAKGLRYRFVEMSRDQFRRCARATGIVQLPCVETPDGTWLTDTTAILDHFESGSPSGSPSGSQSGSGHEIADVGPRLRPEDAATAFCSLLLEDLFDEWLWRPALYYRWAFAEDARLMSSQLARTMLRDVRAPFFLRRWFVLHRQRFVYLRKDGVTRRTAPAIEALYRDLLRELDALFARRPFLFGERPCEADFGLFGPFFRHFFCDPTPGALMRERAPHVAHWVTRLWKTRPADLEGTALPSKVPDDLGFFFERVADDYLPYLEANARAVAAGEETVRYAAQGVDWEIPAAPYRAACLNALKRRFAALDPDAASRVAAQLPAGGVEALRRPTREVATRTDRRGRRGRLWRPASLFD